MVKFTLTYRNLQNIHLQCRCKLQSHLRNTRHGNCIVASPQYLQLLWRYLQAVSSSPGGRYHSHRRSCVDHDMALGPSVVAFFVQELALLAPDLVHGHPDMRLLLMVRRQVDLGRRQHPLWFSASYLLDDQ